MIRITNAVDALISGIQANIFFKNTVTNQRLVDGQPADIRQGDNVTITVSLFNKNPFPLKELKGNIQHGPATSFESEDFEIELVNANETIEVKVLRDIEITHNPDDVMHPFGYGFFDTICTMNITAKVDLSTLFVNRYGFVLEDVKGS